MTIAAGDTFEKETFSRVHLQEADLTGCRFVDCVFEGANLSVARVAGAVFQGTTFRDCKMSGIDWSRVSRVTSGVFERCLLDQCAFVRVDLRRTVFRECRLREAVFQDTDLSEAVFTGTDLMGAAFLGVKLLRADLRGATGYSIHPVTNKLDGARVSLPEGAAVLLAMGIEIE